MVLLHKTLAPEGLKDYRPINLMHLIGKMFAKVLAMRLATKMVDIVRQNQSAFIHGLLVNGRLGDIHDNFKTVQLACRWLYSKQSPVVLLKIDLAKAFDMVA